MAELAVISPKSVSPLRYPGGKGSLANFFSSVIEENNLLDGTYVEPFVGGASVGIWLLLNEYVSNIIINDIDRSIYAFWHSVLNETDALCRMIERAKLDISTWKKCKAKQKVKNEVDLLRLGFATFYLNRTCRSGVLNAGVIGGIEQAGKWRIDARFNKENLIQRIRNISRYRDRISLYNKDACNLIAELERDFSDKTFIYFDPPYYTKGRDLYLNYYEEKDHQRLAGIIKQLKTCKWIVTYDNQAFIKNLYEDFNQIIFDLSYSVSRAYKGEEVMIFSEGLLLPENKLSISA